MSATPLSDAAEPLLEALFEDIRSRFSNGKREYGDSSFHRELSELQCEIEQELMDTILWSFIKLVRLRQIRSRVEQLKPQV